jgi:uncharacterized protein (TIGR02284 family)
VVGTVQRGWTKLRDSITPPTDKTILEECESHEDQVLKAYRAAVELTSLPDALRDVIARQYTEVAAAHRNMRDLRDLSGSKS